MAENDGDDSPIDYGLLAHQDAIAHLSGCWDALVELDDDPDATVTDPASGPFCGCDTCIVREVLYAAWPIMRSAAREELLQEMRQEHQGDSPAPRTTPPAPLAGRASSAPQPRTQRES